MLDIDDLTPYENNPRDNNDAVAPVAHSIDDFGFKVPMVVTRDGVIITGHTRYKAARKLGLKRIPCIIADDLTDEQARAYRLVDNRTGELSTWDEERLEMEMDELGVIDMTAYGFEDWRTVTDDDFGTDFELPTGDHPQVSQATFVLTPEQRDYILSTLDTVDTSETFTFGNSDETGNALYQLITDWTEMRAED